VYDPSYDKFGYHMQTGAYNPEFNRTTPAEVHTDDFALNATKAAAAALARSKAHQEETSNSSSSSSSSSSEGGESIYDSVGGGSGGSGEVVQPGVGEDGYDWNAYYAYYYGGQGYAAGAEAGGYDAAAGSEGYSDYYAQYALQCQQQAAAYAAANGIPHALC
jgi:hypothetical protein